MKDLSILFKENKIANDPVIDSITKKMVAAIHKADKGLIKHGVFIFNTGQSGSRACKCGVLTWYSDFRLTKDDILVNSFMIHCLAFHRDEVPQKTLEIIEKFEYGEEVPSNEELLGITP
jgi:hypothetical protein